MPEGGASNIDIPASFSDLQKHCRGAISTIRQTVSVPRRPNGIIACQLEFRAIPLPRDRCEQEGLLQHVFLGGEMFIRIHNRMVEGNAARVIVGTVEKK